MGTRITDGGVSWRGAAHSGGMSIEQVLPTDYSGRVLLAVGAAGNRRRLIEHLSQHYQVLEPEGGSLPEKAFDLAVVDQGGFMRWQQELINAKTREQPVFLPIMLIIPRAELTNRLRSYWNIIDEFLVSPVDRSELNQRAAMLLRTRRQALAQRSHLTYLVNHDRTTGLPNKELFLDRLNLAVHDATVLNQQLYAAVIQIPQTQVLKSVGARGMEIAARQCSDRLQHLLKGEYSLARLSTDIWGVYLRAGTSIDSVLDVCTRIHYLAAIPLEVDRERIHVEPRIGVAIYPNDASGAESLIDRALSALAQVNQLSAPSFYSSQIQEQALRRIRTEARLHDALESEQFEMWLQPKVRMHDRQCVGAEALVRWRLPSGGLVPPGDFIAVAEAAGLIAQIDRWMLKQACGAMRRWKNKIRGQARVSVNIAPQHLQLPDFVPVVQQTLEEHHLPPSMLELELTETALVELSEENLDKLHTLRSLGVSIALDDFGTGYCSLSYLHRLPITTLKIDKSFVDNLTENSTNAAITQTIVWLARNCDLEVVAEGIETEAQAEHLVALEVEVGQGYLFGRPMPEREWGQWLRRNQSA